MRAALLLLLVAGCVRRTEVAGQVRGLPVTTATLTALGTLNRTTVALTPEARFAFPAATQGRWLLSLADDDVFGDFSMPEHPVFDLLVSSQTTPLVVERTDFGTLVLTAPLEPKGSEGEFVYAFEATRLFSFSTAEATFPVPPGRLRVRARLTAPAEHCEVFETMVRAGSSVRLELRPDPANPRCD